MSFQREIDERFRRVERVLDTLKTNERGGVTGGAVPAPTAQYEHLEADAVPSWQPVASLTVANDAYLHLGPGPGGSLRFNSGTSLIEATVGDWLFSGNVLNVGAVGGGGERLALRVDQDGITAQEIVNTSALTTAAAFLYLKNQAGAGGADALGFGALGTGFTTVAPAYQDGGMVQTGANMGGGLTLRTLADAALRLATAATRVNLQVSSAGLEVNPGGLDLDTQIQALGVADALEVQGNDGQITLGALGAGFVQSDAGGVLSSAAIAAGDLAAHTHAGAGEGGPLVIGTTDTDATPGSVLFAGAAGVIQEDNANLFWDDGNNELGIGTATPDGTLHVHTGSAGAVAPLAGANDLTIENSSGAGMSILSPDLGLSLIVFGTPSDNLGALLGWDYSNDVLVLSTDKVGARIDLQPGNATDALTLQSGGEADFVEYLRHRTDTDTFWRFRDDRANLDCGGVTMIDAVEGASVYVDFPVGYVRVNTPAANAFMGAGLEIDQKGDDDEVLAFRDSTDVAHGMTTLAETDTYAAFEKRVGSTGGLTLSTYTEDNIAYRHLANFTNDTTGKTSTAGGAVTFLARKKSGTSIGNVAAGQNAFNIQSRSGGANRNIAIFAQDGDMYLDTVVNENHWDEHDDLALLHGLRASLVPDGHELQKRFGEWVAYARPVLEKTGVVTYNDDGHHFVAAKKLQMLTIDALRQVAVQAFERIDTLEHRIGVLENGTQ